MRKRVILITGANGQIGSQLAQRLLADTPDRLALLYHKNVERLQNLVQNNRVLAVACDLSDLSAVNNALDQINDKFGDFPDTLIHTAAIRSYDAQPLYDSAPQLWHHIFRSNIDFAYNILHAMLPHLQRRQFGRIVMFGSDVTRTGLVRGSAYAAAKAAVVNLVKTIAREHGGDNILANAISPAPVDTDLDEDYSGEYRQFREEYFSRFKAQVPTHKLITINEIYDAVRLLTGVGITGINGTETYINGGLT